jgi:carbon-monoxide dehydrogenase medium subunit
MYPGAFEYHRAASVQDAVAMLARYGDQAKLLAGGHSLIPILKLRFAVPSHLIDIGRIAGLQGVSESGGQVVIGALTRHADVAASPVVRQRLPALSDAAAGIGDAQVRNRGTIGGSLAHADPGADFPAVTIALGAEIAVAGPGGERSIAADRFFTDAFTTALTPGEMVTHVRIPVPASGTGSAYAKLPDPASAYCLAGVAAAVSVSGGTVTAARVGMTGQIALRARRLTAVESALAGQPANAASASAAAARAAQGLDLFDDSRGSVAYKANLCRIFAARALAGAMERAG